MHFFDDMPGRIFDNFQFVNYEIMHNELAHHEEPEVLMGLHLMMEIPDQYQQMTAKGIM